MMFYQERAITNWKYKEAKLTLSTAKVRTVYSASVSVLRRVILMSPYISVSSGQYLQHFTCFKNAKAKFVNYCKTVENVRVVSLQTENSQDTIYFLSFPFIYYQHVNKWLTVLREITTHTFIAWIKRVGLWFCAQAMHFRLHHEPTALCWIPTDRQR